MFKRRRRELEERTTECLRRHFKQIKRDKYSDRAGWPTYPRGPELSGCATAAAAHLAHLMGEPIGDKAGRTVLDLVDDGGRITCDYLASYHGIEIITQILLLLQPLNLGKPDGLKRAIESLLGLVQAQSGYVDCNPGRDEADVDRVIPLALTLTVLALYREEHGEYLELIVAMHKRLLDLEDSKFAGSWKRAENPSRGVCAATTALVITALMCSGRCDKAMIASSIKFILEKQRTDGSWDDLGEDVLVQGSTRQVTHVEYNAHAIITRAICVALDYLSPALQRRCRTALFRLLQFLVSEQRADDASRRGEKQTAVTSTAIARLAQDMITIKVICDLLFDHTNRYEAWRFQPWDGDREVAVRKRDKGSSNGLAFRVAGLVISACGLVVKIYQVVTSKV
jgi:hypothetical protein